MSIGREAATPRLAIRLPTTAVTTPQSWQFVLDAAVAADRAGIDRLVVGDHIALGERLDAYSRPELGGVTGGKLRTGPDGQWLEPLTALAAVSAVTQRVRLMTAILLAALRRPAVLAKVTSTIDVLSGGRLDLGVGVGWQREEYEAAGVDFDRRGALLDHTLDVLQVLWRDTPASFSSDELTFDRIHMLPKPIQPSGVPIWISGRPHRRVLERIVRHGSGWIPWGDFLHNPFAEIAIARQALERGGRDPAKLAILAQLPVRRRDDETFDLKRTFEPVPGLVEAGVTDLRLDIRLPEGRDAATEFLTELRQNFDHA